MTADAESDALDEFITRLTTWRALPIRWARAPQRCVEVCGRFGAIPVASLGEFSTGSRMCAFFSSAAAARSVHRSCRISSSGLKYRFFASCCAIIAAAARFVRAPVSSVVACGCPNMPSCCEEPSSATRTARFS